MVETGLVTTTISQKASPNLLTLSELFNFSIGAFAPIELYYQDSLTDFLLENLDAYKQEGQPVVHASLNREELITQAQLNRIWGRLKIKAFLPREHEVFKDLMDSWVAENELHPIGEIEIDRNVARVTLEVPLVLIK